MKENYEKVPMIITGKDLDYLTDMFDWNYKALKKFNEFKSRAEDSDIKEMLESSCSLFNTNLNFVLQMLNEGGLDE